MVGLGFMEILILAAVGILLMGVVVVAVLVGLAALPSRRS